MLKYEGGREEGGQIDLLLEKNTFKKVSLIRLRWIIRFNYKNKNRKKEIFK